jgi:putative FmdB family regulatory protein
MPTYEYKCNKCKHQFEQWQHMKEDALKVCPECFEKSLSRVFGVPFVFVKQAPRSLQEQADANSKKFGREECEERELKSQEEYEKARKAANMPVKKKSKKKEVPWWRNGSVEGLAKSDTPISPAQCIEYKEKLEKMGNTVKVNALPPKKVRDAKRKRPS